MSDERRHRSEAIVSNADMERLRSELSAEVATLRAAIATSEAAREQLQATLAAVYGVPGVVELLAARVSKGERMKAYLIQFDGGSRVVEAESYGAAVSAWLDGMREPWGDEWSGDEEPEQVAMLSDEPVIRRPSVPPGERELIAEIVEWQRATFPNKTPESCAAHLLEEARELKAEPADPEEAADVLHLLLGIADACGYDLFEVTRAKFEKNKLRDWSAPPNAEGYVKALAAPAPDPKASEPTPCPTCSQIAGRMYKPCPECAVKIALRVPGKADR